MSIPKKDELIAEITQAIAHTEALRGENEIMGFSRFSSKRAPYRRLLSAGELGGLSLSNRCLIAPTQHVGVSFPPDGRTRRFFLDRADAGLLTTEPVSAKADLDPMAVLRWISLNEALHARGTRILLQIEPESAEAKRIAYLSAAAAAGGFDGVCLNARKSEDGLSEAVAAIRARLGNAFPILCRVSLSPAAAESGLNTAKSRAFRGLAARFEAMTSLARAGVDGFEVCLGNEETPWLLETATQLPAACFAEAARALKAHFRYLGIRAAVAASGRLDSPDLAEMLLENGICDLISLDGAGVSNPAWIRKTALGRPEEILPLPLPEQAMPEKCERIAVIGAGCRGLSYAVRAADAGHEVVMFDKEEQPGGRLALFSSGAAQEQKKLLAYLLTELGKRQAISMRTGTRADPELLKKGGFDRIVFACPAETFVPPSIPGWGEIPFVCADGLDEACSGKWKRKLVAVLGSDALACELAWRLQSEGLARRVSLITEQPALMPGARNADRSWLTHHLPLRGGAVYVGCRLLRMRRHAIVLEHGGTQVHVRCDRIVLAENRPAPLRLYQEAVREKLAPQIQLL